MGTSGFTRRLLHLESKEIIDVRDENRDIGMNYKRCRCIKAFDGQQADDDGTIIESAPTIHVPTGKKYEVTTPGLSFDVLLISRNDGWLDSDRETFETHLEEITT